MRIIASTRNFGVDIRIAIRSIRVLGLVNLSDSTFSRLAQFVFQSTSGMIFGYLQSIEAKNRNYVTYQACGITIS